MKKIIKIAQRLTTIKKHYKICAFYLESSFVIFFFLFFFISTIKISWATPPATLNIPTNIFWSFVGHDLTYKKTLNAQLKYSDVYVVHIKASESSKNTITTSSPLHTSYEQADDLFGSSSYACPVTFSPFGEAIQDCSPPLLTDGTFERPYPTLQEAFLRTSITSRSKTLFYIWPGRYHATSSLLINHNGTILAGASSCVKLSENLLLPPYAKKNIDEGRKKNIIVCANNIKNDDSLVEKNQFKKVIKPVSLLEIQGGINVFISGIDFTELKGSCNAITVATNNGLNSQGRLTLLDTTINGFVNAVSSDEEILLQRGTVLENNKGHGIYSEQNASSKITLESHVIIRSNKSGIFAPNGSVVIGNNNVILANLEEGVLAKEIKMDSFNSIVGNGKNGLFSFSSIVAKNSNSISGNQKNGLKSPFIFIGTNNTLSSNKEAGILVTSMKEPSSLLSSQVNEKTNSSMPVLLIGNGNTITRNTLAGIFFEKEAVGSIFIGEHNTIFGNTRKNVFSYKK